LGLTAAVFKIVTVLLGRGGLAGSFTDNASAIYCLLAATFLQQYAQQFTRSINKMGVYSTTGLVLTGGTVLGSLLFIPRRGVGGYVAALAGANVLAAMYALTFSGAFRYFSLRRIRLKVCKEMLRYSVPLIPNALTWWLVGALNRPLMERHLGMGAVGIFAAANKFPGMVSVVYSMFAMSWHISALEEFGKAGYTVFFNRILRFITAGLILIFFAVALGSKVIIRLLAAEEFYEAWRYIPALCLGAVLSGVGGMAGSVFSAVKKSGYYFYSSLWGALASVVLNIVLIPRYGIMGAAVAVPLSFTVLTASRIIYGWKYTPVKNLVRYGLMLGIAAGLIVVLMAIRETTLKWPLITILFLLFIVVNGDLKEDLIRACRVKFGGMDTRIIK
jgi:O-antigen/teichoic acid export membrane protein